MSLHTYLVTAALLLAGAHGASDNEDARDGYLFLLHDDNDILQEFVLAAKEGNCYFVPISDLIMNSLYSFNLRDTEDEVLKLLNGTTPADVTPINSTAIHSKFHDESADILCEGRQLHLVTVLSHPMLTCDFEHGLCFWLELHIDHFDWVRPSGLDPTSNTGPPFDHTFGDGRGHYLYINASAPRQPGARAYLQSMILANKDSGYCLTFWYYMFGTGLGTLTVKQEIGNSQTTVWTTDVPSVKSWQQAFVSLRSQSSFSVVIEGVKGNFIFGDIAVDDIKLRYGPC